MSQNTHGFATVDSKMKEGKMASLLDSGVIQVTNEMRKMFDSAGLTQLDDLLQMNKRKPISAKLVVLGKHVPMEQKAHLVMDVYLGTATHIVKMAVWQQGFADPGVHLLKINNVIEFEELRREPLFEQRNMPALGDLICREMQLTWVNGKSKAELAEVPGIGPVIEYVDRKLPPYWTWLVDVRFFQMDLAMRLLILDDFVDFDLEYADYGVQKKLFGTIGTVADGRSYQSELHIAYEKEDEEDVEFAKRLVKDCEIVIRGVKALNSHRDLVLSVPDFSCVSFVQQGQKKLQRAAKYTTATGREHSVKKELAEDKSKSMTETPKETPKKKSRFSLE